MRDTVVRGARWRGSVVQGLPYHVLPMHGLLGRSLTVLDVDLMYHKRARGVNRPRVTPHAPPSHAHIE